MSGRNPLAGVLFLSTVSGSLHSLHADDLFIRGDCNQSGDVSIGDAFAVATWLSAGASQPLCLDACDTNNDESVDLSDVVTIVSFASGIGHIDRLPEPFPAPGVDPQGDALDCGSYSPTPLSETSDARIVVISVEAEFGSEGVVQVSLTTSRPVLALSLRLEVSSPFVDPPGAHALELTDTRLSNGISTALEREPWFFVLDRPAHLGLG